MYLAEAGIMERHDIGHEVELQDLHSPLYGVFRVGLLGKSGVCQHIQGCYAGLYCYRYVCAVCAILLQHASHVLHMSVLTVHKMPANWLTRIPTRLSAVPICLIWLAICIKQAQHVKCLP